jgi:hypothetical protein
LEDFGRFRQRFQDAEWVARHGHSNTQDQQENKAMTMLSNTTRSVDLDKPLVWLDAISHFVARHYRAWKSDRARRANLRFVMSLDPIILRDLGYTRDEIAARHDGPLPITRWRNPKPLD